MIQQCLWKSTGLKAKDGMELQERKARAKAKVTRVLQKAKASRRQSPRMAKENRKRALTRARAEQMTDPKEKGKVIDGATFVANLATTPGIAGKVDNK